MMGQPLQTWRSGSEQRAWLSRLIDTFEAASRPEVRAVPCDSHVLAALRAQLIRPASACMPYASAYSLRN
jgi:PHP family Zn ribbon phosphoesterase